MRDNKAEIKSLLYSHISPKRVTSGVDQLRGLASGRHSSETTPDLTSRGLKPRPPAPLAVSLTTTPAGRFNDLMPAQSVVRISRLKFKGVASLVLDYGLNFCVIFRNPFTPITQCVCQG